MPFSIEREQTIPSTLEEVFAFFSDPTNLEALTPDWLKFRVTNCSTDEIGNGTVIDYRLKLRGIPIRWRSLITNWDPPFEFVDKQLVGPYRTWIHRHTFLETSEGVLVRDRVDYSVFGGALVDKLFVRNDLKRVFDYRQEQLAKLMGGSPRLDSSCTV